MIKNLFRTLMVVFRASPGLTMCKLLSQVIIALSQPGIVLVLQNLIDYISVHGVQPSFTTILWVTLLILCTLAVTAGNNLDRIIELRIKYRLSRKVTQEVIEKYRHLDYACFESKETFDTMEKMGESPDNQIYEAFTGAVTAISSLVSIAGYAAVLCQMSWFFAVVYVLMLIPLFFFDYRCCSIMDKMFDHQSTDERRMKYYMRLLSEKPSVFELRVFRAAPFILALWKNSSNKVLAERIRQTFAAQKYLIFSSLTFLAWSAWLIYAVIKAASTDMLTIGLAIALITAITAIQSGVETFIWTFESLSETLIVASYYTDFLALPDTPLCGDTEVSGAFVLRFDHVTFTYPGAGMPALQDISFEIHSDEHLALVGKNGSGKTTLVKLLCRLYRPDSGCITVNGIPLQELSEATMRRLFGAIFQDYGRYKLSLRENVAFGDIEKMEDNSHLLAALQKAGFQADEDMLSQEYGKLAEESIDLSGGQWQRVAIARAYAAQGSFTIMDEPTAALDAMAESALYESILSMMANSGCLVISHRLASARLANRIIVLDGGKIAEQGTHERLVSSAGLYAEMWAMQSALYQNEEAAV